MLFFYNDLNRIKNMIYVIKPRGYTVARLFIKFKNVIDLFFNIKQIKKHTK